MHLQKSWVSVHPRRWVHEHFPPISVAFPSGWDAPSPRARFPLYPHGMRRLQGEQWQSNKSAAGSSFSITAGLTTSVNHNAGLGKATGTCSQAQNEGSRKKGKPSHSAAAAPKWWWSSSPVGKGGLVWGPSVRRVRFSCSWFINKVTSMTVVSAICLGALFSISFWTFHAGIWLAVIRL